MIYTVQWIQGNSKRLFCHLQTLWLPHRLPIIFLFIPPGSVIDPCIYVFWIHCYILKNLTCNPPWIDQCYDCPLCQTSLSHPFFLDILIMSSRCSRVSCWASCDLSFSFVFFAEIRWIVHSSFHDVLQIYLCIRSWHVLGIRIGVLWCIA